MFSRQQAQQHGRDVEQEKHLTKAINITAFERSIAQLITIHNLPHSLVEWPSFQSVLHSINYMASNILVASRKEVPKLIKHAYTEHKRCIKQRLASSLTKIHFSVDMWSSPSHTSYQAIVAHFVDATTRRLSKVLLALREHKGSHSGEA